MACYPFRESDLTYQSLSLRIAIAYVLNLLMRLLKGFPLWKRAETTIRRLKDPCPFFAFLTLVVIVVAWMVLAIPQLSSSVSNIACMPEYVADVERFLNKTIEDLGLKGGFWQKVSLNWNRWCQRLARPFPAPSAYIRIH